MAKQNIDYNAIAFKNRDIDRFSTRFGNNDPEKGASKDAARTAGMTDAQKNLYNLKGELGQRMYAKKVAKENVKNESASSATNTRKAKNELTPEQKETRKTNRGERLTKGLTTLGTTAATTLGALGLYQQAKNKKQE